MKTAFTVWLIASIAFLTTGCGERPAVNSTLTVQQQNALNARLAELDRTLKEKAPFIFAKLAPPATDEQLSELRAALGGAQIQSLETWYQWRNGCEGVNTLILPLGRMLSISEALDDRKMIQDIPFVGSKRKGALMILEDGAGDGFFLDIASPNPRVFYHMLEDPYPRDYGTMQQFVTFITQVYAAELASEEDNGMVVFDLDRYEKLESNYLKMIGSP